MKFLCSVLLFGILHAPQSFATDAPLTLRQHMSAMGFLLDEIYVKAADPGNYLQAAQKVSELRSHLVQAVGLVPGKIQRLNPNDQRFAMIEYHQFMARVIYLTCSLESTLLRPDINPIGLSRDMDVRQLLGEISTVIGQAHGKFR